jgi:hypothetical protein
MNRRYEPASQLLVFTVEYLVDMVRRGRIRIPAYARRYVWSQGSTIALLDSIARGYPIGTMLFSEGPAPDEQVSFGPLEITAPPAGNAYWVVDGQQRLVSMTAALSNSYELDRRFAVSFDIRSGSFIPSPSRRYPNIVPLYILFDSSALRNWFTHEAMDPELIELASDVAWNIRRYQVAAHVIQNDNPAATMEIFERLNTSGVNLTSADLFSAFAAADNPANSSRNITSATELIAERTGFGLISESIVMRAILAVRSDDPIAASEIPYGDFGSAYDEGVEALNRAVVFLQENAGIPHVSFLAFSRLLVALTRFFAIHPTPDTRNLRLLRRWVWRASLLDDQSSHHGDSRTALRRHLRSIPAARTSTTLQSMLRSLPIQSPYYPSTDPFRIGTSTTRMLLCSWWSREPKDLRTGRKATRSDLSAIIGSSSGARRAVSEIFSNLGADSSHASNWILLPSIHTAPKSVADLLVLSRGNVAYSTWLDILESHSITEDTYYELQQGAVESFLERRSRAIGVQFRTFLDSQCEWGHEDTPSLNELIIEEKDNYGSA